MKQTFTWGAHSSVCAVWSVSCPPGPPSHRRCGRSTPTTRRSTGSHVTALVWRRGRGQAVTRRRSSAPSPPALGRVHATEFRWLERMRSTTLYRYSFDATDFRRWEDASGYWVCDHTVRPLVVEPVGDLLDAHDRAGIELRLVQSLWPLIDRATHGNGWDFSIVRSGQRSPPSMTDPSGHSHPTARVPTRSGPCHSDRRVATRALSVSCRGWP